MLKLFKGFKNISVAATGCAAFAMASTAMAHVRWFAPADLEPMSLPEDFTAHMLCAFVGVCCVIAIVLDVLSRRVPLLDNLFNGEPNVPYRWMWYLLLGLINIFLIINLLYGDFLAPNLALPLDMVIFGVIAQAAVLVIMPWSISLVGALLVLVALSLFSLFPVSIALDYVFEFAGVGLALIMVGPCLNSNDRRFAVSMGINCESVRQAGVQVLRVFLGLQLLELAVQNKLMIPQAANWFIDQNPFYNFFPLLGLDAVSNLHFVLFIGLSETALGLLLIFNVARRLILLMLIGAFSMTGALSGGHELTGHIPIIGVILVLLVEPPTKRIKRYKTYFESDFEIGSAHSDMMPHSQRVLAHS